MEIAVIDPNTLTCLGMKQLLGEVAPEAAVRCFPDFGHFIDDTPDMYDFYFITSQTFILYTAFFHPRSRKVVILIDGMQGNASNVRASVLNTWQDIEQMKIDLICCIRGKSGCNPKKTDANGLTLREIEVLRLVTQGFINKEIAEKLNISLTTVISHRKNITAKLGIKSVSGLTIYAVMNGYVEADRI